MKKIYTSIVSLTLLFVMSACFDNSNNEVMDNAKKDVEKGMDYTNDSIDQMMDHFKTNEVNYNDEEKLDNFDFAATEGRRFKYQDQDVYVYRMDMKDEKVNEFIQSVKDDNRIQASLNDKTMEYGASVNGNYLLVYDKNLKENDALLKTFNSYKNTSME